MTGNTTGAKLFGNAFPTATTLGADGSIYAAGFGGGSIDFGGGPQSCPNGETFFIVKLNPDTTYAWSKALCAVGPQNENLIMLDGLAVDVSGNLFVTGSVWGTADVGTGVVTSPSGAMFVSKLTALGEPAWSKTFLPASNTDYVEGHDVAIDAAGHLLVSGSVYGSVDLGGGLVSSTTLANPNGFLLELDASGGYVGHKKLPDGVFPKQLRIGSGGGGVLTGVYSGAPDLGAGPLPSTVASTDVFMFVTGIDASGTSLWSKGFGKIGLVQRPEITIDPTGEIAVAGTYQGVIDFGTGQLVSSLNGTLGSVFVAKLGPTGNAQWARSFDLTQSTTNVSGLGIAPDGDVVVAGDFVDTIRIDGTDLKVAGLAANKDLFAVKLTGATGATRWMKTLGGPGLGTSGNETLAGGMVDSVGHTHLVGSTDSPTLDVGTGPLSNPAQSSFLLIDLAP
jgi:hypothetical protein